MYRDMRTLVNSGCEIISESNNLDLWEAEVNNLRMITSGETTDLIYAAYQAGVAAGFDEGMAFVQN